MDLPEDLFRDGLTKIPTNVLQLGTIDVTPILDWMNRLPREKWLEDVSRQTNFKVHKDTESIVFKWSANNDTTSPVEVHDIYYEFEPLVAPILETIQGYYKYEKPTIRKMMFAKLKAGGVITRHTDAALALRMVHRIHVPLVTNDGVHFYVNDVDYKLGVGEILEIDNVKYHAVENKSSEDRVHLIIDYYHE